MSNEIEVRQETQSNLAVQMDYARAVSQAAMLPDNYRNRPADIMLAVGLGQSMGLSPAESLYRISVIKGKPTASAELIAANVRKAGHKLRVRGDDQSCTATIVRADDPDYEFTVTRDLAWAERMGLSKQDNYRKQPGTMLQWRAITAVARLACPEALYGVSYTPDEVGDMPTVHTGDQPQGLAAALGQADEPQPLTDRTRGALFALMGELGINTDDDQRAFLTDTLGRVVESRSTLTEDEGREAGRRLRKIQAGEDEWVPADLQVEGQQTFDDAEGGNA